MAFGAVFYGGLLHWVPFTLDGIVPLGLLSGTLLLAILTGIGGLQGLALQKVLARTGPIVALPLVWGGTEFLLAHAGPLAMPWTPMGLALAPAPRLAAPAEWVGVRGVGIWIALVNGGAVLFLRRVLEEGWTPLRAAPGLLVLLATVGGSALWGAAREATLPVRATGSVLATQFEIPRDELLDREARDRAARSALRRVVEAAEVGRAGHDISFALLPEAPFGSSWEEGADESFREAAAALNLVVLAGSHRREGDALRNSVFLVHPQGDVRPVHDKVKLVPLAEWPGLEAGRGLGGLRVGGVTAGVLICSEAAFDREARRLAAGGAELLLHVTNDGWFRPRLFGLGSAAHSQHRAHLVLRAVESRVGAVRSAVGGELLLVSPAGRILHSRRPGTDHAQVLHPVTSTVTTGFVRVGDLSGWACAILLLIAALGRRGVNPSSTTFWAGEG